MHQTQWSLERPLPPQVSLASQSHHEKPPEVTCTSLGNPGFPAPTRERPPETFFNTSRGQIPLPWLGSSDALPLATGMETRFPHEPHPPQAQGLNQPPGRLGIPGHPVTCQASPMQPQVSEGVRSPQQAPASTHTHSSPAPLLVNFQ